jgi:hypothetical protein
MKRFMFRTVPLSIIRSFSLYTQQWYMSYRFADSLRAGWACLLAVSKPVWHIPLLCVLWKTPDDGQRNSPKHVEFHSKNKFEKLVHLVGFITRQFRQDSQSPGRDMQPGLFWTRGRNLTDSPLYCTFIYIFDTECICTHAVKVQDLK